MFRLLGIFAIGNLLFGGRRHHSARCRGLVLGALLSYLSNRDFDMDRVRREARETARKARRTAHDAARTVREEIRNARRAAHDQQIAERLDRIHAETQARKAERETRKTEREVRRAESETGREEAAREIRALPVSGVNEAKEIRELVDRKSVV